VKDFLGDRREVLCHVGVRLRVVALEVGVNSCARSHVTPKDPQICDSAGRVS